MDRGLVKAVGVSGGLIALMFALAFCHSRISPPADPSPLSAQDENAARL